MRKRTSDAEEVESENDGKSRDPFGGVLRGADADTSRSKLEDDDFARFEASWLASQVRAPLIRVIKWVHISAYLLTGLAGLVFVAPD